MCIPEDLAKIAKHLFEDAGLRILEQDDRADVYIVLRDRYGGFFNLNLTQEQVLILVIQAKDRLAQAASMMNSVSCAAMPTKSTLAKRALERLVRGGYEAKNEGERVGHIRAIANHLGIDLEEDEEIEG
jgi:hypothetical protein